jgi:hypothetical protein
MLASGNFFKNLFLFNKVLNLNNRIHGVVVEEQIRN